jgi:hypothetical protein
MAGLAENTMRRAISAREIGRSADALAGVDDHHGLMPDDADLRSQLRPEAQPKLRTGVDESRYCAQGDDRSSDSRRKGGAGWAINIVIAEWIIRTRLTPGRPKSS